MLEGIAFAEGSWKLAHDRIQAARGVAIYLPERIRPLVLTVINAAPRRVRNCAVFYRVQLEIKLVSETITLTGNFEWPELAARQRMQIALLDTNGCDKVHAQISSRPIENVVASVAVPEPALVTSLKTHETTEILAVVYCPTGVVLAPAGSVARFKFPDKVVEIRVPAEREARCLSQLPGVLAVAHITQCQGSLLHNAYQAARFCDGLLSTAFAATLADMQASRPIFVCDARADVIDREFIHFFYDRMVVGRRAQFDVKTWIDHIAPGILNADHRVIRAVRWLRKMFSEDDILDRFIAGWTGLETLNPLLSDHFGVPRSAEEKQACGSCGHETVRHVPRVTGVKELLFREGAEELYKECHGARNGLVHGFQSIEQVTEVALNRAKDVGFMLARGISVLSGVPLPTDPKKFEWLGGFRIATVVFAEGSIKLPDLDGYIAKHGLPLCEHTILQTGQAIDTASILTGNATIKVPPDVTITFRGMGVVAGPGQITSLSANRRALSFVILSTLSPILPSTRDSHDHVFGWCHLNGHVSSIPRSYPMH